MSTPLKGYSGTGLSTPLDATGIKIGIVVAEWNQEVTQKLLEGAVQAFLKAGGKEADLQIQHVPGSFEITYAAKLMAEAEEVDAVVCLGCVIRGETPHFDYICQSVSYGITELNLSYDIPFIFGVLTTNTSEQALDRAGGKYGNKGEEATWAAIRMAEINM